MSGKALPKFKAAMPLLSFTTVDLDVKMPDDTLDASTMEINPDALTNAIGMLDTDFSAL